MAISVGAGVSIGGLVVGALDDFLGKLTGRCAGVAEGNENWQDKSAFWAVFSGGVCDCVGARELLTFTYFCYVEPLF